MALTQHLRGLALAMSQARLLDLGLPGAAARMAAVPGGTSGFEAEHGPLPRPPVATSGSHAEQWPEPTNERRAKRHEKQDGKHESPAVAK